MWLARVSFIFLILSETFCEECVIRNFEEDFDLFASGTGVCGSMAAWTQRNYTSTNINSPHDSSISFVTPQPTHSCLISETFTMAANGILQLRVYLFPRTFSDYVTVIAYEAEDTISIVGQISSTLADSNFSFGWNTLNITLTGGESYEGYVAIVGRVAANSDILVDFLRYVPPSIDTDNVEELCPVHIDTEDNEDVISNADCIEYDFKSNYESLFNNDYDGCNGLETWTTGSFIINSEETFFITPNVGASCSSSVLFEIESSGTLEVNVYMVPLSASDVIAIFVVNSENQLISSVLYHSNDSNFVFGMWTTIVLPIDINEAQYIQIVFISSATQGSIVLIESFKFTSTAYLEGDQCSKLNDVAATTHEVV